jgi:flagellin
VIFPAPFDGREGINGRRRDPVNVVVRILGSPGDKWEKTRARLVRAPNGMTPSVKIMLRCTDHTRRSKKIQGRDCMRINHNMSAIFANRQLQIVADRADKTIEKLASGQAINRAGDDASGLAVSEKMRTQINGLFQAEKNAQNGLSFIQVAEGSLSQINDILQRIRTLSVQSANGIYSNDDRKQVQVEVSSLIAEIDRIATSAEFNRMKMLTGVYSKSSTKGSIFFHVGPNSNQRIRTYIATMSADALNLKTGGNVRSISTVGSANQMIGYVDRALDRLNRQRAELGAYYNRMENTTNALQLSYENMMAADSRIRDADMAAEMVEFTKNQILVQSGVAMLAQANAKPKLMIGLLAN